MSSLIVWVLLLVIEGLALEREPESRKGGIGRGTGTGTTSANGTIKVTEGSMENHNRGVTKWCLGG